MLSANHGLAHFIDGVFGRVGREAYANAPEVKGALKELQYRLEESKEKGVRLQALRPPLSLLRGWEVFVMEAENDTYDRTMAWYYFVSTWGVLRFDDHRGFHPSRAVLD